MSESTEHATAPDGSTDTTAEQEQHTENLADGSPTGNATEDPNQDTDTTSGGEPEES